MTRAMDAAMDELQGLFRPDGYDVSASVRPDRVELRVHATDAACESCLVPKDIMRGIVADVLVRHGALGAGEDLVLVYPNDA